MVYHKFHMLVLWHIIVQKDDCCVVPLLHKHKGCNFSLAGNSLLISIALSLFFFKLLLLILAYVELAVQMKHNLSFSGNVESNLSCILCLCLNLSDTKWKCCLTVSKWIGNLFNGFIISLMKDFNYVFSKVRSVP